MAIFFIDPEFLKVSVIDVELVPERIFIGSDFNDNDAKCDAPTDGVAARSTAPNHNKRAKVPGHLSAYVSVPILIGK